MVTVTYEDMSMSQLKSLCRDKGLGTGRSKQELIDKLTAYDSRDTDDTDLTEDQIDDLMKKGDPVEIKSTPEVNPQPLPETPEPGPTVFRVSFPHSGPLLDSDHDDYRLRTRHLAQEAGYETPRGLYAARLDKVEGGFLYYEIGVK
jgi:hypothetical protein